MIDRVEGKIELTQFNNNPQINRMSKLAGVRKIVLSLDKLDNTGNLEDGRLSNVLLTYHVTGFEEFIRPEPAAPQY